MTGILMIGLMMRLLDAAGVQLGFFSVGLTLIALTSIGVWAGRGRPLKWPDIAVDWRQLCGWRRVAYAALFTIIAVRLCNMALEILWRPLFPWDAWQQWATKTRVWYELGHFVPFVPSDVWLAGTVSGAYTDFAPHYPSTVSMLQTWTAYSLGRWDDSLINLPWLGCAIALALAFYGQARHWKIPPLFALGFTYLLMSLPMLDTHIALAGYADLFMASFFGLGAMAFFQWSRTQEFWQGIAALIFATGCTFIKQPGVVWMLTFLPALWVVKAPRTGRIGVPMLGIVVLLAFAALGSFRGIELLGYSIQSARYAEVLEPVLQNLLILDNWHMTWHLTVLAIILSGVRLLRHDQLGMTTLVATAMFFLTVVFCFTKARTWAEDYTTLNRAFLHALPMVLFYVMVQVRETSRIPFYRNDAAGPKTPM